MARTNGSGKAALLGLIIGGAVGVGIGLLIAPEEGQKVRRRLVFQLDRLAAKLNAMLEPPSALDTEARQSGRSLVRGAEEQAHEIMHDVDALINEVRRSTSS